MQRNHENRTPYLSFGFQCHCLEREMRTSECFFGYWKSGMFLIKSSKILVRRRSFLLDRSCSCWTLKRHCRFWTWVIESLCLIPSAEFRNVFTAPSNSNTDLHGFLPTPVLPCSLNHRFHGAPMSSHGSALIQFAHGIYKEISWPRLFSVNHQITVFQRCFHSINDKRVFVI